MGDCREIVRIGATSCIFILHPLYPSSLFYLPAALSIVAGGSTTTPIAEIIGNA